MVCAVHQECMSDRLEGQRQQHAIQLCQTQADELGQWLIQMRTAVISTLEFKSPEEADMEDQLAECQVSAPSAVHSE